MGAGTPTISFTVSNQTYGAAPFAVAATSNSTGAFTYSVVSGPATITGSTVTLTGAGTVVLQASEAADSNYAAAAKWLEHSYPGTEHLLIGLCQIRPSAATDILMRLGAQPRDICHEVLGVLGHQDDWQRWLADHPDM